MVHRRALDGVTVLDVSESIAGQYCSRMLADFGATVTLVEPPTGSHLRRTGPFDKNGDSQLFFHLNLGKAGISLDPATPSGRLLLCDLSRNVDVVVAGPGVDRTAIKAASPTTIVALVSGFGVSGALSHWRGSEMIFQALSGMMKHNGVAEREPLYGCGDRASYAAGVAAYISVLSALFSRQRQGRSQDVAVEVLETASSMSYPFQTQYIYNGSLEPRGDQRQPLGQLRCSDGWLTFWIYDDRWQAACRAFKVEQCADDPRFANPKHRIDNWEVFLSILQQAIANESAVEVVERLQAAGIISAKAYGASELKSGCAHLQERGFWEKIDTPAGVRTILGPQFRLSQTPRRVETGAPSLGHDNARVYGAMGLAESEIDALRRSGVI